MKAHQKLYQKLVSKVTLHFVWGHLLRIQTVGNFSMIDKTHKSNWIFYCTPGHLARVYYSLHALGFATIDLATARDLTDLCQYINSDLVLSDLKLRPLYSEIATFEVVLPDGLEQKLLLATTWWLYQVEIPLI